MKVLHVIGSISRQGGGPSRSSQGLVACLRAVGIDAWLMTINHGEEPWIKGCEKFINGGSFESALVRTKPDIVHLHGIWNMGIHRCAVECRKRGIPYVIAPRGMLEPWSLKQKWLKKRLARWLYQDRDLKKAAALHATAESESEQFRKLGFRNYVIVSPNGVNLPEGAVGRVERGECVEGESNSPESNNQTIKQSNNTRRALFVSRMHPKKGVLELVESWARVFRSEKREVSNEKWQCELVYTLNGETEWGYEQRVKQRILDLGMSYQDKDGTIHSSTSTSNFNSSQSNIQTFKRSNISCPEFIFTGPLDDDAKWQAYARADLFILPTYSENFGIVVAEALWAGVPVITTKGTPWVELEGNIHFSTSTFNFNSAEGRCGWWIELPGEEGRRKKEEGRSAEGTVLVERGEDTASMWPALDQALLEACGAEGLRALPALGANGHRLVESKYTWPAVVKAMVHGYEQILNPCPEAPCDLCYNYGDTCPMK